MWILSHCQHWGTVVCQRQNCRGVDHSSKDALQRIRDEGPGRWKVIDRFEKWELQEIPWIRRVRNPIEGLLCCEPVICIPKFTKTRFRSLSRWCIWKKNYRLQGPSIRANYQKMSTGSSKNASACFQCLLIVPIFCSSPVATGSPFCCLNTTVSHSIVSLQCLNSQHVKPPFLFQPIIAITSISLPPDNKVCLIGEKKNQSLYWWFLKPNGFVWEQDAPKICYGHQFFRLSPIFRRAIILLILDAFMVVLWYSHNKPSRSGFNITNISQTILSHPKPP